MKPPVWGQLRGDSPQRVNGVLNPCELNIGKTKLTPSLRDASKIPTVSSDGLPVTGRWMRMDVNGPNDPVPTVERFAVVIKPVEVSAVTVPAKIEPSLNEPDTWKIMECAQAGRGAKKPSKANATANACFVCFTARPRRPLISAPAGLNITGILCKRPHCAQAWGVVASGERWNE